MSFLSRDARPAERRERPFTSATEKASMGTLLMAFVFVASLFLLYKFADWSHDKQVNDAAAHAATSALAAPMAAASREGEAAALAALVPSPGAGTAVPEANPHVVTKCTVNGKTSYGDGPCAHDAVTTLVTTRPESNLLASTPVDRTPRPETALRPAPVVAQVNGPSAYEAKRAECQVLDAQINNLDAMSRQPQTAQAMDRIAQERRKARDQQFRIQCP